MQRSGHAYQEDAHYIADQNNDYIQSGVMKPIDKLATKQDKVKKKKTGTTVRKTGSFTAKKNSLVGKSFATEHSVTSNQSSTYFEKLSKFRAKKIVNSHLKSDA